jgi:hypothetical protein
LVDSLLALDNAISLETVKIRAVCSVPFYPNFTLCIRRAVIRSFKRAFRATDAATLKALESVMTQRSRGQFDIVSRRGGSVSVLGSIAVSTPLRYETSAFSASTP